MRTLALIGALCAPAMAQVEDPCAPRMPAPTESTRTADGNGRTVTVSAGDQGDGRSMTATYTNPVEGSMGVFQMTGSITWVNDTTTARNYEFRQLIPLGDGVVPMIPDGFDWVCYEPAKQRLVTVYKRTVAPGETVTEQIYFEITTRSAGQIADLNGDGWVDSLDVAEMIGAINGQEARYDLNGDGIVDVADLAILQSMLSESWQDDDQAAADPIDPDPTDPVVEDTLWASSDAFIEVEFLQMPSDAVREGHWGVPLTVWQSV